LVGPSEELGSLQLVKVELELCCAAEVLVSELKAVVWLVLIVFSEFHENFLVSTPKVLCF